MKIKPGFIVKEVVGDYCIVPVDDRFLDFGAMITTNETGAFLFGLMQEEFTCEAVAEALCKEYDVDFETALSDVEEFVAILSEKEILE